MRKTKKTTVNIFLTLSILMVFFLLCLGMTHIWKIQMIVPTVFTLAVFLISLITDGYIYGIIASMLSVLIQNFVFTYPYFAFNFTIPENMISAVIMLVVSVMTCALMTKVMQQEKVKAEIDREKMRANLLRAVSHDLRTP